MADPNRAEQLEGLRNITTNQDFYEKLAAGHSTGASSSSPQSANGAFNVQYIPVPITIKAQLGSPTALAIGAFATTLTTLSFALMGWRGMSVTNAFIGNFFGVAGIGMVISAQWEIVLGNTYAYTVLSAFGLFYLGFGIIVTPLFGVAQAYGGADTPEYYNALGFFVLSKLVILPPKSMTMLTCKTVWAVFNFFFLIGSAPLNIVYFGIFFTVQLAFTLVSAGYFLNADGFTETATAVNTAAGAFAFASGMLGYYTVANLMCQEALGFNFPMGDTSRFFKKKIH
jgi:succinate-acetate transporter protein